MKTTIANDALQISADTLGAELTGVITLKDRTEWLWQADPNIWSRHAPILFPIVGKLEGNRYRAGSNVYTLSQHGFARDCEFRLTEEGRGTLLYQLTSDEESLKKYPYSFELSVRYTLDSIKLKIEYGVKNTGDETMLFSIGAHPGFNCPFRAGEKMSDYILEFEKEENAVRYFLENGVFSGRTARVLDHTRHLPVTADLFNDDAVIFKDLASRNVALKSKKGSAKISLAFEGFPYLGIWSKPGANFICIEPWCGIADTRGTAGDLKKKEGIIALESGAVFKRDYSITIES